MSAPNETFYPPAEILPHLPAVRFVPSAVSRTKTVTALSGHMHSRLQGARLWQFRIVYPSVTAQQFAPVMAFLATREGRSKPFFIRVPHMVTDAAVSVGGFANILNDYRLYMVTNTSPLTLTPTPPTPPDLADLCADPAPVYLRASLTSDVQSFESSQLGHFRFEFTVRERLL